MNKTNNPKLTGISKTLRKNMTEEERHLWYVFLKHLPLTVNRQKVIGNYIVDFYIAKAKLVIELDGIGHAEDIQAQKDRERDAFLESLGLQIVRFNNEDINHKFDDVCRTITDIIEAKAKE